VADHGLFARPVAPHRVHDVLLIAAHAAGDLAGHDEARAETLVASCAECAALAGDLRAIQRLTATVGTPSRPRDFRLTVTDAQRLGAQRDHSVRLALRRPRFQLAQPAAAGVTMLGLAGLLVATIPWPGAGGSGASGGGAESAALATSAPGDAAGNHLAPSAVRAPAASGGTDVRITTATAGPSGGNQVLGVPITPPPTAAPVTTAGDEGPADLVRPTLAVTSAGLIGAGSALWLVARRRRNARADGTDVQPRPSGR